MFPCNFCYEIDCFYCYFSNPCLLCVDYNAIKDECTNSKAKEDCFSTDNSPND